MQELEQVKKRFKSQKEQIQCDCVFNEWHRIYRGTNENLAGYMKDLDNKDVLTVCASGDFLINAINLGAKSVDTFDINKYAPLYQELRLKAIKYLEIEESLHFLYKLDDKLYKDYAMCLSDKTREFFDYLFNNYSVETIYNTLFDYGRVEKKNNTYFNVPSIMNIKNRIDDVNSKHFSCSVYSLPYMLDKKYDCIYLSNISQYQDADKYLYFLRGLSNYLKEDGVIYFGYLYSIMYKDIGLDGINKSYRELDLSSFDDVLSKIEDEVIPGASCLSSECDKVIKLRK